MTNGIDLSQFSLQNKLFLSQTLLSSLTNSSSSGSSSNSSSIGDLLTSLMGNQNTELNQASNVTLLNLHTAAMALNSSNSTSIFSTSSTPDAKTLETDVNNFIAAYNKAVQLDSSGSSASGSLTSFATANATALQAIGITIGSDGTLSVDQTALGNAISANPQAVQNAFNGSGSFAANIQSLTMNTVIQSFSEADLSAFLYGNNNSASSDPLLNPPTGQLYNTTV